MMSAEKGQRVNCHGGSGCKEDALVCIRVCFMGPWVTHGLGNLHVEACNKVTLAYLRDMTC